MKKNQRKSTEKWLKLKKEKMLKQIKKKNYLLNIPKIYLPINNSVLVMADQLMIFGIWINQIWNFWIMNVANATYDHAFYAFGFYIYQNTLLCWMLLYFCWMTTTEPQYNNCSNDNNNNNYNYNNTNNRNNNNNNNNNK